LVKCAGLRYQSLRSARVQMPAFFFRKKRQAREKKRAGLKIPAPASRLKG